MAKKGLIIEGEKELNKAIAKMEAKLLKKNLKKAAKQAGKIAQNAFKSNAPRDSGALANASVLRVHTKRHKMGTGKFRTSKKGVKFEVKRVVSEDIGSVVFVSRKSLMKQIGKRGNAVKFTRNKKGKSEMVFYPAFIELGTSKKTGKRVLTRSLHNNQNPIKGEFKEALRKLVMNPK